MWHFNPGDPLHWFGLGFVLLGLLALLCDLVLPYGLEDVECDGPGELGASE